MKEIYAAAKENPLFHGIEPGDFEKILGCMRARVAAYKKDDVVLLSGEAVRSIGLVLAGGVRVLKEDADGGTAILTGLGVSELFGEVFACAEVTQSPVTGIAAEDTRVLWMDYKKVVTSCAAACPFHSRLITNMLKLIARKNLMLNQKNEILSKRTTRGKLLAFFDTQRGSAKKFTIPYNREELARYLCVDRSAMSCELCRMRDEGILKFNRNSFELT